MLIFFFFLHQLCLRFIFTTNPSLWLLATPLYSNNLTPMTPQTYGTEEVLLHCFWMVLVVVCTTMFLFVKSFLVSLLGD